MDPTLKPSLLQFGLNEDEKFDLQMLTFYLHLLPEIKVSNTFFLPWAFKIINILFFWLNLVLHFLLNLEIVIWKIKSRHISEIQMDMSDS